MTNSPRLLSVATMLSLLALSVPTTAAEEPRPPKAPPTSLFQLTILELSGPEGEPLAPELVGAVEHARLPVAPEELHVFDILTVRAAHHVELTTMLPTPGAEEGVNPTFARFEAILHPGVNPHEPDAPRREVEWMEKIRFSAVVPYRESTPAPDGSTHTRVEWRDVGFNVSDVPLPAERMVYLGEVSTTSEFGKLYVFGKRMLVE